VTGTTGPGSGTAEPRNATITYPGGLRARWRWAGSGQAAAVFALSESGGSLLDLGPHVSTDPDALCRAELRLDGPRGSWTARFASTKVDPVADHEATFAEAQPWLTGPYRASFLKRFQARLDDPAFRDALASSGKAPPEWNATTAPPKAEAPPPPPAAKAEPERKFRWPWEK